MIVNNFSKIMVSGHHNGNLAGSQCVKDAPTPCLDNYKFRGGYQPFKFGHFKERDGVAAVVTERGMAMLNSHRLRQSSGACRNGSQESRERLMRVAYGNEGTQISSPPQRPLG
jgi:hypothetical protein